MIGRATPGGCIKRKGWLACVNERLMRLLEIDQTTREKKIAGKYELRKKNGCRPQYYYEGNVNRYMNDDWKCNYKKTSQETWSVPGMEMDRDRESNGN